MRRNDRITADSYYEASRRYRVEALSARVDEKADVVVIGGGITGASTALHLAQQNVDVAVLESRHFGWGASGRSGGQIINGYSIAQARLEKLVGMELARELWDHSLAAVELTRDLVAEHAIDCDLVMGYLHAGVRPRQADELRRWAGHMARHYDYPLMEYLDRGQLQRVLNSERYSGAVQDPGSGHLHPLNYTLGLALAAQKAGARLYEDCTVEAIDESAGSLRVTTSCGAVTCSQLVFACNAYLDHLEPTLSRRIMPVGSCIIATEPLSAETAAGLISGGAAVSDSNFVLDYYRLSADNRLLFGGRVGHDYAEPVKLAGALQRRMLDVFPQLAGVGIDYTWGGFVAVTRNRAPHIGCLEGNRWFAQGFSGHGMALTGYIGKLLARAVCGDRDDIACFECIPHRTFPGGSLMHTPVLAAASGWYRLRDRLA